MTNKTKTFSGRADAQKLEYADRLARASFDMSFGQYCSSVFLDAVCANAELPSFDHWNKGGDSSKLASIGRLKELSGHFDNPDMAVLSDDEIREMIEERYAS